MFWEYSIRKMRSEDEDRHWEKFGRHMGTTWNRSDFEGGAATDHQTRDLNRRFYPHAILVSPNNIHKQIAKDFEDSKPKIGGGEYRKEAGEEIVETSDMSSDDFKEFFDQISRGLPGGA